MDYWTECVVERTVHNSKVFKECQIICRQSSVPETHLSKFIGEYFEVYTQKPGLLSDFVVGAFERTQWPEVVRHIKALWRTEPDV